MTISSADEPRDVKEPRIPRRDLLLLPLLGLLTTLTCLGAGETGARYFFAYDDKDTCLLDSAKIDSEHRPNCTTRLKAAEGPWISNEYNDCGYRTREPCKSHPVGVTRIALIGSSGSEGLYVEYAHTFAARTADDLTRTLGRPVEVQNLGRKACLPICVYRQIDGALALKPDLLMWAVDPYDIEHLDPAQLPDRYLTTPLKMATAVAPDDVSPMKKASKIIRESDLAIVGLHFFYQNTTTYAQLYLNYGDRADYLRTPFSHAWESRFEAFDILLTEMVHKSSDAHVPFVLIELPSLAQASLSAEPNLPPKVDPYAFNKRLQEIASRHGVEFIDGLDALRAEPEPNRLFYVTDGHLNAEGHELVSRAIVEQLTREQHAALMGRNDMPRQEAIEREK